jgi:peptide/nickel transport system permease protein
MGTELSTDSAVAAPRPTLGSGSRAFAHRVARNPVVRVVVRRLGLAVPLMFVVSALSFILSLASPFDPVVGILGLAASPASKAQLRHQFLMDQPFYDRYWNWLEHAVHGDLGKSWFLEQPVVGLIEQRFPVTLSLVGVTLLLSLVFGVTAGVVSAVRGGFLGRLIDSVALVGFSLPGFWVGAVLISIFAVRLRWLPAISYVPLTQSPTEWLRSIILPVVALSLLPTAVMARQTRARR